MAGRPEMTECWRSRTCGRRERHEKGEDLVGKTWLDPGGRDPHRFPRGSGQGAGGAGWAWRKQPGKRGSNAIPFTLRDGYLIVVEGRIGGNGHLKLALDTGATHSVLRSDLAKGQKFLRRPVRIVNLDRVLTQELAEVSDFALGPIRIPLLPMMLNDLEYLRETAPVVDGLIGLDVLRGQSFSIDFGRRRIIFGSSRTLRSSATDGSG